MTPQQHHRRAVELAEAAENANPASPETQWLIQRAQLHAMLATLEVLREVDRRLNPDPIPPMRDFDTVRGV